MKVKFRLAKGVAGALLCTAAGCYNYLPPPVSTIGNTYTGRERDQADKLLDDIEVLGLAEAQRIALYNNPTYLAAGHSIAAARMRYYQAWGEYSPVVTANFQTGWTQNSTRHPKNVSTSPVRTRNFSTSTGVAANWLVFDGLAREFSVLIADHDHDRYKLLEEDASRTMMRAVAYAYNAVLLAIANQEIAIENRKFQESSLKDTQVKFQAGTVPLGDVLNFQIQRNMAESSLVDANYQYSVAIHALAVLMGYPDATLPERIKFPTSYRNEFNQLPAVEIYLDAALANRPDLKAYREELQIARYQMYQTYSAYSPTVNASVSYTYGTSDNALSGGGVDYTRSYSENPSFGFGLSANWTIFNGFIRYNKMREYQANVAIADFQVAAQWLTVMSEVRISYDNYVQNVRQAQIYQETRDLSAKQRDLVDEGYRAGNVELTRLNEAQRDLVEAESNLASSIVAIQNAKAQLDASAYLTPSSFYSNPTVTPLNDLQRSLVPSLATSPDAKPEVRVPALPAAADSEPTGIVPPPAPVELERPSSPTAPAAPVTTPVAPAIPADPTVAPKR